MEKSATALRQRLRDIASTWLLAIVLLVAALVVTYQFVGPAPPRHIVLATGEASGAYHLYGQRLAEILARDGIHLELRTTAGSVENLGLVREGDAVDLAFVQSGIAGPADAESVAAIGTMYLEPLWLFARSDLLLDDLGDLEGNRIAVGARGSGTRAVVLTLLDANGVSETNSQFAEMPSGDMANAFSSGDIDAAFVVGSPAAAAVTDLIEVPGVTLQDMQRAAAYPRRYPFLSTILLPRGVLDFQADRPAQDIHTIAFGAMLVAREDFHPALTDLLLVAAGDVFGGHDLLADAGQFPTPQYVDLPLSEEAERHFDYGPPFLMRPPAYRWQIRRRLLRIYAELDAIDPQRTPVGDEQEVRERFRQLDRLENEATIQGVPRGYTDDVYKLRRDIDLVRRRLGAASPAIKN
jgi:TRAP transporter TAXI family solute receptor